MKPFPPDRDMEDEASSCGKDETRCLCDVDLASDELGGRSCSTTLSTTSDTSSEASFLPSFHDSDDPEPSLQPHGSVWHTEILRHRSPRDPWEADRGPPARSPPHATPLDQTEHDERLRNQRTTTNHWRYIGSPWRSDGSLGKPYGRSLVVLLRLVVVLSLTGALVLSSPTTTPWPLTRPLQWRTRLSQRQVRRLVRRIQQSQPPAALPTVTVLLTGHRLDLLQASLDRHAHCAAVDAVHVDWRGPDDFPDSLLRHGSAKVQEWDHADSGELAQAVLLLEEGIHFDCRELERAYREWRRDPVKVVGLLAPSTRSDDAPALVSDAALLLHRLLLPARPRQQNMPKDACQSFALSAFVTKATARASVPLITKPRRLVAPTLNEEDEARCRTMVSRSFGLKIRASSSRLSQLYVGP